MSKGPLDERLARERDRTRRDLVTARFEPSDYRSIHEDARKTRELFLTLDPPAAALAGVDRSMRVLEQVLALDVDPGAEILPPTQVQVYEACIALTRASSIIEHLAPRSRAWRDSLIELLQGSQSDLPLHFASIAQRTGHRMEPGPGETHSLDLGGWSLGVLAAPIDDAETIGDAVGDCTRRLREQRRAGLALLDLSAVIWPERTVLKVGSDATTVAEVHRMVDECLIDNYDTLVDSADTDHLVGVVGCLTLGTLNASSRRLAFATNFRIATLLPEEDARNPRLIAFARKLASVGV